MVPEPDWAVEKEREERRDRRASDCFMVKDMAVLVLVMVMEKKMLFLSFFWMGK